MVWDYNKGWGGGKLPFERIGGVGPGGRLPGFSGQPSYQGIPPGWISFTPGAQQQRVNPYLALLNAYGSTLRNWQSRQITQANSAPVIGAIPQAMRSSGEVAGLMSKLALGRGENQLEQLGSAVDKGFYTDQAKSLWGANLQMDKYMQDIVKQRQEEAFKQRMIDLYTQKVNEAKQQFQDWNMANRQKSPYEQYLEMARKSKYYNKDGSYKG